MRRHNSRAVSYIPYIQKNLRKSSAQTIEALILNVAEYRLTVLYIIYCIGHYSLYTSQIPQEPQHSS